MGDTLHIVGLNDVTVRDYTGATITTEDLTDTNTNLLIDQAKYFSFKVDAVDNVQSSVDLMTSAMDRAAKQLAEKEDENIYGLYASAANEINAANATSVTILSKIAAAKQKLMEADVSANEDITLEVSPAMATKIQLAQILFGQPNADTIDKGYIGQVLGMKVYVTNSISNDGTYDYCYCRTGRAIAHAQQLSEVKMFEPEGTFGKGVKGLLLFGSVVVRPAELVTIKFSAGAETTI